MEDTRTEKIGGINIAYEIWEASVVPMLTHNSESWVNMSKKTMKLLHDFFNTFHRIIMRIGSGCPTSNLYWQSGSLLVHNLILKKKLMFYPHLSCLPRESLAGSVFQIQKTDLSVPGLVSEVNEHIVKIGIPNPSDLSKWQWKALVRKYINHLNKSELLESIKKYKKFNFEQFSKEDFARKPYFYDHNLKTVRALFRLSSRMIETVRGDFPNKYRKKSLICPSCRPELSDKHTKKQTDRDAEEGPTDSLEHLKWKCEGFKELRSQYNMTDDAQLVEFFENVVSLRKERGED